MVQREVIINVLKLHNGCVKHAMIMLNYLNVIRCDRNKVSVDLTVWEQIAFTPLHISAPQCVFAMWVCVCFFKSYYISSPHVCDSPIQCLTKVLFILMELDMYLVDSIMYLSLYSFSQFLIFGTIQTAQNRLMYRLTVGIAGIAFCDMSGHIETIVQFQ